MPWKQSPSTASSKGHISPCDAYSAATPGAVPVTTLYLSPMRLTDSHTHHLRQNATVNIDTVDLRQNRLCRGIHPLRKGYTYSVGIHPWNSLRACTRDLLMLRALAADPKIVAIGETGLDTLSHNTPSDRHTQPDRLLTPSGQPVTPTELLKIQTELLKIHISLSEELQKPLILHIVKRFPEIIRLKTELRPTQPWIIHGFRGKPQLAKELLRHGFHLSYGDKFNPASVAITPTTRLHIETDTSPLPIKKISASILKRH